ncbi:BON domain-containing protein [Chitinasiproducens palmae]|uniref:Osmotically-inducible protein Y n=1 Tax=Chitinasiproducens palmae TaxID=1770053 RepID=A0A1H2PMD4_9BURK|nr:BON domain-containing protein [Chitinasiproducens palmae]SDV47709.1 BON domain-containing protein [Chitinasiproducens palmae]
MKKTALMQLVGGALLAVSIGAHAQVASDTTANDTSNTATHESVGDRVSDGTVTTKVKAALLAEKNLKSTKVHVKTRHGVVRLTGSVPTADEKARAEEVVRGVNGVKSVTNRLKVVAS